MRDKQQIIKDYIQGYNDFNIDQMLKDLDPKITFKDIQDNRTVINLQGKSAFEKQAYCSGDYFSSRKQTIESIHKDSKKIYTLEITFEAVLKTDLPNGLKKGQQITLKGKSIFEFKNDKIISLTDIS